MIATVREALAEMGICVSRNKLGSEEHKPSLLTISKFPKQKCMPYLLVG